jgi:hypothetical protein
MEGFSTVKVSKKTLKRLHQLVGKLTIKYGRRVSLEEAIKYLFEKENLQENQNNHTMKTNKDKIAFLALLNTKFDGITLEDYKEYDFEEHRE